MRLGVCIGGGGTSAPWRVEALGGTAVSWPYVHAPADHAAYLGPFRERGWDVMAVLGPRGLADPADWRLSTWAALARLDELVRDGLVTHVALGHEPDDGWAGETASDDPLVAPRGGVGSWVLSTADLAELVYRARQQLRRRVPLLLGGLVSARPEYLSRLDLSGVDGVLIHPYADVDLMALLDGVAAEIAAQGQAGRVPIGIGELGRSDHGSRRGAIADWYASVLPQLARRGDVSACFVCCDSDLTLDGYGQFDAQDRAKPSVPSIFEAARRFPGPGGPERPGSPLMGLRPSVPQDEPQEPDEDDDLPWPEVLGASPEELARALGPPPGGALAVEDVAATWVHVGPHLALYGQADNPAAAIALAATIWVGTAGTFVPGTEEGRYDRCERLYGRGTQAGLMLGNRHHGDGHRFRARGLVPIRGRAAYRALGELLGLDLEADPELLAEAAIAVAALAALFERGGLWDAARRGDWARIRRLADQGLNGYEPFLQAVQRLWWARDAARGAELPTEGPELQAVYRRALTRVGQGGLDGGDLVRWAYLAASGTALPTDPDELAAWAAPIGPDAARPGDLVLYSYGDPARAGARFAHVGLATDREDLVLDGRVGLGVGTRPHVRGAVRRYRRVILASQLHLTAAEDEEEAMWKERYDEALARVGELADAIEAERAKLNAAMPTASRPPDSAVKAEHVEYGQAMERWQGHIRALLEERDVGLERVAARMKALPAALEVAPGTSADATGPGDPP